MGGRKCTRGRASGGEEGREKDKAWGQERDGERELIVCGSKKGELYRRGALVFVLVLVLLFVRVHRRVVRRCPRVLNSCVGAWS